MNSGVYRTVLHWNSSMLVAFPMWDRDSQLDLAAKMPYCPSGGHRA